MDNRSPEQQTTLLTPERQEQIDSIVQRDHQAFTEWLSANPQQPRLDVTPDAARYFIPRRLLELADNPSKVQIRLDRSDRHVLDLFIVEEMPKAISDSHGLSQIKEAFKEYRISDYTLPKPQTPHNVDPKHAEYIEDLDKAGIRSHDKILLAMHLEQIGKDEIFVGQYDDREELRGKGVAMATYERLSQIGLALGERYITGRNRGMNGNRKRINFFIEKLGRLRFSDLQGDLRQKFWERHNLKLTDDYEQFAEQHTIAFLYPEEKPSPQPAKVA